jgi:hypothetical protein
MITTHNREYLSFLAYGLLFKKPESLEIIDLDNMTDKLNLYSIYCHKKDKWLVADKSTLQTAIDSFTVAIDPRALADRVIENAAMTRIASFTEALNIRSKGPQWLLVTIFQVLSRVTSLHQ